jgi:hypothetical protein
VQPQYLAAVAGQLPSTAAVVLQPLSLAAVVIQPPSLATVAIQSLSPTCTGFNGDDKVGAWGQGQLTSSPMMSSPTSAPMTNSPLMSFLTTRSPTSTPMMSSPTSLAAVAGQPPSLAAVARQSSCLKEKEMEMELEERGNLMDLLEGVVCKFYEELGERISAAIFCVGGLISGGSAVGATSVLNDSNKCYSSYSYHILAVPSRDSANDACTDDATTTGNTSDMTHYEIIAPKLPQWPSKKTNFKSPPDCWWSEMLDMEKRGYVDLSDKSGNTVLCLLCQEGKGKTDGVIALHRPFSKYNWAAHEQGDKYCKLLKQCPGEEENITEGKMKEKKNQVQFLDTFCLQGRRRSI